MKQRSREQGDEESPRRDPEGGAALVVVLIFGVGAMSLVTLLLTLTHSSLEHEADRHRRKALQTVLVEGVSLAFHELQMNNYRAVNGLTPDQIDPGDDGVGALIRTRFQDGTYAADTTGAANQQGVEIADPTTGLSLGFVRSVVASEVVDGETKRVLLVAAATPNFQDPRSRVSAKLLIGERLPPWLSDRQAFSVVGESGSGSIRIPNGAHLDITSTDRGVPAVNITDGVWHDSFVDSVTSGNGSWNNTVSISGSDEDGDVVSTTDTILNHEAGVVDNDLATDMTTAMDQLARDVMRSENGRTGVDLKEYLQDTYGAWGDTDSDGDTDHDDITDTIPTGTWALGDGDFYIEDPTTTLDGTLTGSGSLIVAGDLTVKGEVSWDGNVVVTHERTESEGNSASLTLVNGSRMTVGATDPNSVLAINAGDGNGGAESVSYSAGSGSALTVNGALLLTSANTTGEFSDSGSTTVINGIVLMVGDGIDYTKDNGGAWTVNGSMVFAAPEVDTIDGAPVGANITLESGSHSTFNFNNGNFDSGLEAFAEFVDVTGTNTRTFPLSLTTYLESPAWANTIDDLLGAGTAGLGFEASPGDQELLP